MCQCARAGGLPSYPVPLQSDIIFKVILFDLDDTLMPDESAADEAILAVAQHAKAIHNIAPEELRRSVRRIARRLWRSHPVVAPHNGRFDVSSWSALSARFDGNDEEMEALHAWAPEYRHEVWALALAENGIADPMLSDQLAALYPSERRARYLPFPDAVPTLDELKQEYKLALVTNGPRDLQCDKLERAGLGEYFPVRVISREVGVMKPNPCIFAITLERLGVSAAEAVMVGDSLRSDIAGAQAAGIRSVWFNPSGSSLPEGIKADAVIGSLAELPGKLSRV